MGEGPTLRWVNWGFFAVQFSFVKYQVYEEFIEMQCMCFMSFFDLLGGILRFFNVCSECSLMAPPYTCSYSDGGVHFPSVKSKFLDEWVTFVVFTLIVLVANLS